MSLLTPRPLSHQSIFTKLSPCGSNVSASLRGEWTKKVSHRFRWRLMHFNFWNKKQPHGSVHSPNAERKLLSLCLVVCLTFGRKTQHFWKASLNECIVDNIKLIILKCAMRPSVFETHCSPAHLFSPKQVILSARTLFEPWEGFVLVTQRTGS